jgi:hypothetical protein
MTCPQPTRRDNQPAGIADSTRDFSRLADYGKIKKGVVSKFAVMYA